jgi:hypothetical protein
MKKAGDLLPGYFETYGIKDEKNYSGFVIAWNELIGNDLASHCRPLDIRGTVLIVAVDHPGWMTRIQFDERKILKKVQKRFPQIEVTSLAFSLVKELPKPVKTFVTKPVEKPENTSADLEENLGNAKKSGESKDDPAILFSALEKLKKAMDKKSGSTV